MELLNEHFGELVVGIVLAVFGWGFTSWSQTLSRSTKDIIARFSNFMMDYHNHKIESERRITKLETQVEELEKMCHDNRRRHDSKRNGGG